MLFILVPAIFLTIWGLLMCIRKDFSLVPTKIRDNLTQEQHEFMSNFSKGIALTGICLLIGATNFIDVQIIRFAMFGFTLAYSDLFLRRARKLANSSKTSTIKTVTTIKRYRSKHSGIIASIFVVSTVVLGIYLVGAFMKLTNNKPFADYINLAEVETASVNLKPINTTVELNSIQLEEFINIFSDIVVYEELVQPTLIGEPITYIISINDGCVYEIAAMGDFLFINLNNELKSYIIQENISEKLIFLASSL